MAGMLLPPLTSLTQPAEFEKTFNWQFFNFTIKNISWIKKQHYYCVTFYFYVYNKICCIHDHLMLYHPTLFDMWFALHIVILNLYCWKYILSWIKFVLSFLSSTMSAKASVAFQIWIKTTPSVKFYCFFLMMLTISSCSSKNVFLFKL